MRRIAVFCTILMMAQVVLTGCASGTQESDVREQTEETSAAEETSVDEEAEDGSSKNPLQTEENSGIPD